jgi:hypothetical protein
VKSEINPQKRNAMRDVVLIKRPDMRRILTGGWELAGNVKGGSREIGAFNLFGLHLDSFGDLHGPANLSAHLYRLPMAQVGADRGRLRPIQIPSVFNG